MTRARAHKNCPAVHNCPTHNFRLETETHTCQPGTAAAYAACYHSHHTSLTLCKLSSSCCRLLLSSHSRSARCYIDCCNTEKTQRRSLDTQPSCCGTHAACLQTHAHTTRRHYKGKSYAATATAQTSIGPLPVNLTCGVGERDRAAEERRGARWHSAHTGTMMSDAGVSNVNVCFFIDCHARQHKRCCCCKRPHQLAGSAVGPKTPNCRCAVWCAGKPAFARQLLQSGCSETARTSST